MKNKKLVILATILLIGLFQTVNAVPDFGKLTEITSTNFLPETIRAGDIVSLAIDIKNRGSSITIIDLNATLDLGNQFEIIESNDFVATIKPQETKTITFRFRVKGDTFPGYFPTFLTLNYFREETLISEKQTILVPVTKTDKNIEITMSPKVISPGKINEIIFTIRNIGGSAVSNLSFSWEEENDLILPLGSDNKRFVSIVNAKESIELVYTVAADPNITTGIYPLDITISFTDFNGTRTQTSTVGLIIGGKTDFEVSAEILNSGQLSISIANIGSNNAEAVVIKIPQQQGINISGSTIEILGNLNKGDFTIANFETRSSFDRSVQTDTPTNGQRGGFNPFRRLQSNNNTETNDHESGFDQSGFTQRVTAGELEIEIDYTDTTGERQSVIKNVQLSSAGFNQSGFTSQRRRGGFPLLPVGLLILIVGGATAYNKLNAKRNWKTLGKILAVIIILFLVTIFLLQSNTIAMVVSTLISLGLLFWFFFKTKDK